MSKYYFEIEKNGETIRCYPDKVYHILSDLYSNDPTHPFFDGENIFEGFFIRKVEGKLHRFNIDDQLRYKYPKDEEVIRIITGLCTNGTYEWKYPFSDDIFVSSNSSDPYLEFWEKYN